MSSYCISRAIEGIVINGNEYLLNDDDSLMVFESVDNAKDFLIQHGYTEEDLECFNIEEVEE